jgi:chromosome segregation ATPase
MFDRGLSLRDDYRKINKSLKNYQKIYNLFDVELVGIEEVQAVYEDKKTIVQSYKDYTKNIQNLNTQILVSNEFVEGSIGILVDEIVDLDNEVKNKQSLLDDIDEIKEQQKHADISISDLKTKIENYNKEIKILEEQLKTTKEICSSCDGEGFVTIYKAN